MHSTNIHSWTISVIPAHFISFFSPREHSRPVLISCMSYITSTEHCIEKKGVKERKDLVWRRGWWNEFPQEEIISLVDYMSSCSSGFPFIWKNLVRTSIWDKRWTYCCFLEGAEQPAGVQNDSKSSQSGLQLRICVMPFSLTNVQAKQTVGCFLCLEIATGTLVSDSYSMARQNTPRLPWNSSWCYLDKAVVEVPGLLMGRIKKEYLCLTRWFRYKSWI